MIDIWQDGVARSSSESEGEVVLQWGAVIADAPSVPPPSKLPCKLLTAPQSQMRPHLLAGLSVVSHSWSGIISPSPLKRVTVGAAPPLPLPTSPSRRFISASLYAQRGADERPPTSNLPQTKMTNKKAGGSEDGVGQRTVKLWDEEGTHVG